MGLGSQAHGAEGALQGALEGESEGVGLWE